MDPLWTLFLGMIVVIGGVSGLPSAAGVSSDSGCHALAPPCSTLRSFCAFAYPALADTTDCSAAAASGGSAPASSVCIFSCATDSEDLDACTARSSEVVSRRAISCPAFTASPVRTAMLFTVPLTLTPLELAENESFAVREEAAHVTPFGTLLHFRKDVEAGQPRVMLVAPLSGAAPWPAWIAPQCALRDRA